MLLIAGLGVFEALYGFIQWIGVFQFAWIVPINAIQGTLMNHNHFALLLNIGICAGIGVLYLKSTELLHGQTLNLRSFLSIPESPRLFWILIWIAFMGVGVIISVSRMGIFAMLASLGFMVLTTWLVERRKYAVFVVVSVLLAIATLGVYAGIDAAFERYAQLARTGQPEEGRVKLWKDAWPMIKKAPIFGSGLGSFQWTYPAYESLDPDLPAIYAHNDYLQVVAETGIVGLALLLWAFAACFKSAVRNFLSNDLLVRGVGLATIGVLVAAAIQEITDYSLYIPGVAAVFILFLGLNERARWLEKQGIDDSSQPIADSHAL